MSDKEQPEWIIDDPDSSGEEGGERRDGEAPDDGVPGPPAGAEEVTSGGHDGTPTDETGDESGREARDSKRKSGRSRARKAGQGELLDLIQQKNAKLQKLEKRTKEAEQLLDKKEDKLLRMAAEFENYRKRTRREWELHQTQANAGLIKDILGVIDDFDRALEAAPGENDTFASGIRLIYTGLLDVLRRAGLSEIESADRPFDPRFHEAMGETATEEVPEGYVAHVVQKGYLFGGEVLRPARVIVARKPEA